MFGMIGRTAKGFLDYIPGVDTMDDNLRPFRSITSPNAYKREQAAGMPSFGMIGRGGRQQAQKQAQAQFTPPFNGNASNPAMMPAAIPQRNRFSLGRIGAALQDASGGNGNLSAYDMRDDQKRTQHAQMMQQQQRQQQMVKMADDLGLQGRERLAFMHNPEAYAKEVSENYGFNQVTAGNSVYQPDGSFKTAPKLVNNGNQFFTQGAGGTQITGDYGQTYEQQITSQNNLATQQLRQGELGETIRNNDLTNARDMFSNDTSRMNAVTNRQNADTSRMTAERGPELTPYQQYQIMANERDYESEQKEISNAAEAADRERLATIESLNRLLDPEDLQKGIATAYGKSRYNPFQVHQYVPGSRRNTAMSVKDKVVSNLTLDKIANFKGAISDKDLEVAQSAATTLQNPHIGEEEAFREIKRLRDALQGTDGEGWTDLGNGVRIKQNP